MSKRGNGVRASVRALSSSVAVSTVADAAGTGGDAQPTEDGEPDLAACRMDCGVGIHDEHLHGPDGRVYRRTSAHITPSRAQELLRTGAAMAVADCGCGGHCGLDWPSPSERIELGLRPPRLAKNRFGWGRRVDANIVTASLHAVLSALARSSRG